MRKNSIASVGSVVTKSTEVNGIYQGVPAVVIRKRKVCGQTI
jgi:putative colanic acid biosynthesis acetyltransferase WcaF